MNLSESMHRSLRYLSDVQPVYMLPEDDLLGEVMIPYLTLATSYDCLTAFFHTSALREMAMGLAEFLARPDGKLRLAVSPYLSVEDHEAMKKGVATSPEILARRLEQLIGSARIDASALVRHTLECFAYLIAAGRIAMKVVLVRDGLFHPKIRIFSDGKDYAVVHGSNNLTTSGLTTNFEQVMVSKSWAGSDQAKIARRLQAEFEAVWHNRKSDLIRVFDCPEALKERIIEEYSVQGPPTPEDFWHAWKQDEGRGPVGRIRAEDADAIPLGGRVFSIPTGIDFERGDFAHQGSAVRAWEAAGRKGILEMATGSGKTIAALVAAQRLANDTHQLLITIAVPYLPLVSQWADEVKRFGLGPIVPGSEADRSDKLARVQQSVRNLKLGVSDAEILVVTHDFLCDLAFQTEVNRHRGPSMLIADEVHHLGTQRFLTSPRESFHHRLGLSATPTRQYDEVGTEELTKYFGEVVFRFTLEQAIGTCLVPYDYYVHEVHLTEDEIEQWLELTEQLRKKGWKFSASRNDAELSPDLQRLLTRRRLVLEQAENKLRVLKDVLSQVNLRDMRHTLVYASDKGRDQLQRVNRLLMDDLNLRIHQITQEETANRRLIQTVLDSFARGDELQVLTAMRVLDEGVDIPEVSTAYILASTTVERQWVQRRGRILRKCSRTGKQFASLHDFIVVPPASARSDYFGEDIAKMLEAELRRVLEFAKTSRNSSSPNGALTLVSRMIATYL